MKSPGKLWRSELHEGGIAVVADVGPRLESDVHGGIARDDDEFLAVALAADRPGSELTSWWWIEVRAVEMDAR